MNFQWYPGHMTKAKRQMQEDIKLIDLVVEIVDARIPHSSRNPDIDELGKNKYRLILMNKADLADKGATAKWKSYFEGKGYGSAVMDFIKTLFRINNRTGCRFLIVDAYNNHRTLHFYEKNGFKYLIEDEESEATYVGVSKNKLPLNTRLMYFDLLDIKVN